MKKGAIYLIFVLLFSCQTNDSNDIFCTTEVKAGLNVSVHLAESSSSIPISQGVTVVITDGNYSETLQFFDAQNPIYYVAYERAGTYIITVTKAGRQTYVSQPIVVTRDICHVIPQTVMVSLL
jgi:hypothetical protein